MAELYVFGSSVVSIAIESVVAMSVVANIVVVAKFVIVPGTDVVGPSVVTTSVVVSGVVVATTVVATNEQDPSELSVYPASQPQTLFSHTELASPQSLAELHDVLEEMIRSEDENDTPALVAAVDILLRRMVVIDVVSSLNVIELVDRRRRVEGFIDITIEYVDFTWVVVMV